MSNNDSPASQPNSPAPDPNSLEVVSGASHEKLEGWVPELATTEELRAALEKAKAERLKRTLVGLEMVDRGIARDGYRVLDHAGGEIGYVTSGSPAPFLKKNIALAYVPPEGAPLGTELKVEIRGQGVKAVVVPTPFYKKPKKI